MVTREQWILFVCLLSLGLILAVIWLLRRLREQIDSLPQAPAATARILDGIEGMRQQFDVMEAKRMDEKQMEQRVQTENRRVVNWLIQMYDELRTKMRELFNRPQAAGSHPAPNPDPAPPAPASMGSAASSDSAPQSSPAAPRALAAGLEAARDAQAKGQPPAPEKPQ